jgi:sortase A
MPTPIEGGLVRLARAVALGLAVLILVYLVALPLYPLIRYEFISDTGRIEPAETAKDIKESAAATGTAANSGPAAASATLPQVSPKDNNPNRIIIKKIGVDAPIVESADEKYGLNHGVWLMPTGSSPDKGGNTIITGHRFKYLPPNNLTFFLLDKLTKGDEIQVNWRGKVYGYQVDSTKIVPAEEVSILEPTDQPILTIFTCDPIFSTTNRLVIIAKPI